MTWISPEQRQAELRRWTELFEATPQPPAQRRVAELLEEWGDRLPRFRGYSVAAFADWIYELDGRSLSPRRLREGEAAEWNIRWSRIAAPTNRRWRLVHDGMKGARAGGSHYPNRQLFISALSIRGRPMAASPDLVFRRIETDEEVGDEAAAIVEIKATDYQVPHHLWLNVRAQLWAYGQIDELKDASTVYLGCEIWNSAGRVHRHSYGWQRSDGRFDAECEVLFQAYASTA